MLELDLVFLVIDLKKLLFLRLTADNPLVDPYLIDNFIKFFKKSKGGVHDRLAEKNNFLSEALNTFQKAILTTKTCLNRYFKTI